MTTCAHCLPTALVRRLGLALLAMAFVPMFLATTADAATSTQDTGLSVFSAATGGIPPREQMLVEADGLVYNMQNRVTTAKGHVSIYYGEYKLFADRVEVNRDTGEMHALGNVSLYDGSGAVVRGEDVKLDQKLSSGFISVMDTVSNEGIGLQSASTLRPNKDTTVFNDAIYSPCVDCNGHQGEKPLWRVKARKVTRDLEHKTLTFEDMRFEVLGMPVGWLPWISITDPTVRRQSGFLTPSFSYQKNLGYIAGSTYFWAVSPSTDLTFNTTYLSRQGSLLDVSWRHALSDGTYSFRVAGLKQRDITPFVGTSGHRTYRGTAETSGQFYINDHWTFGWSLALPTDRSFYSDYQRKSNLSGEAGNYIEDISLIGQNENKKKFEAHLYGFYSVVEDNTSSTALPQTTALQSKQPIVHPSIDYNVVVDKPIYDGELSYNANMTSISRSNTDIYKSGSYTREAGVAGHFTRLTVNTLWRKRMVDQFGQVFTPFASATGDVIFSDPHQDQSGIARGVVVRGMPTIGAQYSYPIMATTPIGAQVFEPVAQLILRPNETGVNKIVNEDSQSVVFDDTSLFDLNKFSGYDRQEGGGRANLGFRVTSNIDNYGTVSTLVGRSYQIYGTNSYDISNIYATGADSGLNSAKSDWVARVALSTDRGVQYGIRARFDTNTLQMKRTEAQIVGSEGPVTASLVYAFLAKQPALGIDKNRREVLSTINTRITDRYRLFGSTRYDIQNHALVRYGVGLGFDDQSFSYSFSVSTDTSVTPANKIFYLRVGLRTLGGGSTSYNPTN